MDKFFIDQEAADRITVSNLKDYRNSLQRELNEYFEGNSYLHPLDVTGNRERVLALDLIINDFE